MDKQTNREIINRLRIIKENISHKRLMNEDKELMNEDKEWFELIRRNGGISRCYQFFKNNIVFGDKLENIITSINSESNKISGNISLHFLTTEFITTYEILYLQLKFVIFLVLCCIGQKHFNNININHVTSCSSSSEYKISATKNKTNLDGKHFIH